MYSSPLTAKRSPLSNRRFREPTDMRRNKGIDSERVAQQAYGALFQSASCCILVSAGPSDTTVIERRRFQRLGAM